MIKSRMGSIGKIEAWPSLNDLRHPVRLSILPPYTFNDPGQARLNTVPHFLTLSMDLAYAFNRLNVPQGVRMSVSFRNVYYSAPLFVFACCRYGGISILTLTRKICGLRKSDRSLVRRYFLGFTRRICPGDSLILPAMG